MRKRILVVDDEESIREIITSMLAAANYDCGQAGNGREALATLAADDRFELILTGLLMPDMGGLALLEQVKRNYSSIPVFVASAAYDSSLALDCFRGGAYDYLPKPFFSAQLLKTTLRTLENHALKTRYGSDKTTLELLIGSRIEELQEKLSKPPLSDEDLSTCRLDDEGDYAGDNALRHLTILLAQAIGVPSAQVKTMARAAYLHDVGEVPSLRDILVQRDVLHPDEVSAISNLRRDVYEMLNRISFLEGASEIVYAYTEWFDGTGCPRGLKAGQIPLGARILAAAHTISVFRHRCCPVPSLAAVRAEAQRLAGSQLDPEVVEALLSMPEFVSENRTR